METNIDTEWHRIGAESRAAAALAQIRKKYRIRHCEVNSYHDLAYGTNWEDGVAREWSLKADVFRPSFPRNLVVTTVFPISDGKTSGVEAFLKNGNKYERLVLTNSWLIKSLRSHPDFEAWLYFSEGRSLTQKALDILIKDMHLVNRDDLAQQVAAHRNEVALLNYCGTQLVLFPDHHAIVWRWSTVTELFDWPAPSLNTQRCSDYNTVTEGCVGAIIRPDGSLER